MVFNSDGGSPSASAGVAPAPKSLHTGVDYVESIRANCAALLGNLAHKNPHNQAKIAQAGGLAPLVNVLLPVLTKADQDKAGSGPGMQRKGPPGMPPGGMAKGPMAGLKAGGARRVTEAIVMGGASALKKMGAMGEGAAELAEMAAGQRLPGELLQRNVCVAIRNLAGDAENR